MKHFLALSILINFISCQKAGLENQYAQLSDLNEIQSSLYLGYVWPGANFGTVVSIIGFSKNSNSTLITTVEVEEDGYFEFELNQRFVKLLFIATDGMFFDPVVQERFIFEDYSLRAIYDFDSQNTEKIFYITPFSEIFYSYYECLKNNSEISQNSLSYAISSFESIFEFDVSDVEDLFLNDQACDSDESSIYTTLNLGFSAMYLYNQALHPLDLVQLLSQQIENDCSVIFNEHVRSGNYSFYNESFRLDYLNAVSSLSENLNFEFIDHVLLENLIQSIRQNSSFIFSFEEYENE